MSLTKRIAAWADLRKSRQRDVDRREVQSRRARRRAVRARGTAAARAMADAYRAAERRLAASRSALTAAEKALAKLRAQATARVPMCERAYNVAAGLVGVVEQGGNNRGPKVTEIIRANGGFGPEPWCGDFVAYCYRLAGSRAVTRAWAAVVLIPGVTGIRRTSSPKRGDLVRFNFPGGSPDADHIGVFVRDLGNGWIETIEGNTGDAGEVSDSPQGDGIKRKRRPKGVVRDYLHVTR